MSSAANFALKPNLWRAVVTVAFGLLLVFPLLSDDLFYQNMIILSLVFAIGAVGLNVIMGFGGYISLGQSAFIGLGAYTVGIMTTKIGGDPFIWVPVAGVVAALFAALLGLIAMRTRGFAFVIITIAGLFILQIAAINLRELTGGSSGITLPLPMWPIEFQNWPFYYTLAGLLIASVALSWWIRRTKIGTGLLAIREDEDKAATIGINTPVYKIIAFVASAVFLGMAGGVYGYYLAFIDPLGTFDIVISVQIVLAVILGGRGTLFGPVLGAFLIESLNEFANQEFGGGNSRLLIFGGLLALTILLLPDGIVPSVRKLLERAAGRNRRALVGARLGERKLEIAPVTKRAASGKKLLVVEGLQKSFGGVQAVNGCSFEVEEGTITGLIGPNGSGKTTTFNLIGGTMSADAGKVWLDGERIDGKKAWSRAYAGLGRTFQITRVFRDMTVLENVVAPLRSFSFGQLRAGAVSGEESRRADELLEFVGMSEYRDRPAEALSFGQRKLVELAQVLMLDPKLILLDEPAGGINPTLINRMADMIRELNAQGKTFLIVEHNMPLVLSLCEPIVVLAQGACICEGNSDEIQRDPKVLDAYLGDDFKLEEPVGV
ncbi:branched-chain amino acid ABC transporter ATP-binding protein/permease [Thermoleophilia bacterium SCSIO 60948]|nr:branched-chain amino acid ABC transporter ATP-binding protein/permease [Thermoleophilia bacterium SCSIO 60948]